jgi:hypothetical protein
MTAAVLRMQLTAVLLVSVFFASDSLTLMPLVIVAVVVAFVVSTNLKAIPRLSQQSSPPRARS